MLTAMTINNTAEAIGIVEIARAARMPVVISFTVETDGCLPSGEPIGDAIMNVDEETGGGPAYYMINCAHPTHLAQALDAGSGWLNRLRGIRANASCRSHAELDSAPDLDDGNPVELGAQLYRLRQRFPQLTVLGGCCGTDHRHIAEIALACSLARAA
jgi:S-methylmethionine-dependent homocysteine/selenocysteine methylase